MSRSSSGVSPSQTPAPVVQEHARTAGVDVQTGDLGHNVSDTSKSQVRPESVQDPLSHPYFSTFKKRVLELFSRIPAPDGKNPMAIASEIWTGICQAMHDAAGPMADPSAYSNYAKGWLDMSTPTFQSALAEFDGVVGTLASYCDSQFDKARTFGFWSKPEGKTRAEAMVDLSLETSGVGALFNDIPTLDAGRNGWDPQLWSSLSRGYANAVAKQVAGGDKQIHVCIGGGATRDNIWGSVESKAIEKGLQGTGLKMEDVATFHAVPAVSKKDRSPDMSKSGGDFKGTLYSGDYDTALDVTNDYWSKLPDA